MYRPWLVGKFGVEFEFTKTGRDRSSVTEVMIREALESAVGRNMVDDRPANWRKSEGRLWDIKTDSSAGWEVASPALSLDDEGRNIQVSNACAALTNIGAVVNERCGTHQHHETPGYDWRDLQRLIALWARYEPFFFELQPARRRDNNYCSPICRNRWGGYVSRSPSPLANVISARSEPSFDRYARQMGRGALNIGGWWANGRIEIRLHSGTLNATKVLNWAMLMKALIARVKHPLMPEIELSLGPERDTGYPVEYIAKQLGLLPSRYVPDVPPESLALVSWLKARHQQFNPQMQLPFAAIASTEAVAFPPVVSPRVRVPGLSAEELAERLRAMPGAMSAEGFVPQHVERAARHREVQRTDTVPSFRPWEPHPIPRDMRCAARIGAVRTEDYGRNMRECFVNVDAGAVECPNQRMNTRRLCAHHYQEWCDSVPFSVVPWPSSATESAAPGDDDIGPPMG